MALGRRRASGGAGGERPLHLFHAVRLDPVADLKVVEVLDADAALETLTHLANVVLEPLQARERSGVDLDPIAGNPRLRGALDGARADRAPRDGAHLAHLE